MNLGMRMDELRPLRDGRNKWLAIDVCSAARLETLRVLDELDTALVRAANLPPGERIIADEAERAVAIRFVYARFREEVPPYDPSRPVHAQLDEAMRGLETLLSRPCYSFTRIHDRRQIREVHARMRAWLAGHAAGNANALDGQRLYQDLYNVVECLMGVNHRPEVRVHDKQVLLRAVSLLQSGPPATRVQDALDLLHAVPSRSDEIDALLRKPLPPERDVLLALAMRALQTLATGTSDVQLLRTLSNTMPAVRPTRS
jgi:hypothetical protein